MLLVVGAELEHVIVEVVAHPADCAAQGCRVSELSLFVEPPRAKSNFKVIGNPIPKSKVEGGLGRRPRKSGPPWAPHFA